MEATDIRGDRITIEMTPEELTFLANAITEALEAVEAWEFQTRTGETRQRATEMQAQLVELLELARRR